MPMTNVEAMLKRTCITLAACAFTAEASANLDWIDVDQHRRSGTLVLGVSTRAELAKAWNVASEQSKARVWCLKGPERGWLRAGFLDDSPTATVRWLEVGALARDDPSCTLRQPLPSTITGMRSGLRLGNTLEELLLTSGKLFRAIDDEWIFENVGERRQKGEKVLYQLLIQGRIRDNRVYQYSVSFGEVAQP
jgi:hypothetical protein